MEVKYKDGSDDWYGLGTVQETQLKEFCNYLSNNPKVEKIVFHPSNKSANVNVSSEELHKTILKEIQAYKEEKRK